MIIGRNRVGIRNGYQIMGRNRKSDWNRNRYRQKSYINRNRYTKYDLCHT